MADFTGFYLDGVHSSTYGIIRTSDGDRYTEGLIPEFDDYDIELVGGDGDIYEGRRFKKTSFTIPIAFDHLTEKQLRELRQWIGGSELKEFRFDERPYKAYWVKLSSRPELEYICFMEDKRDGASGEKERIYKGDGELEFTAYDPFGYCADESWELTPQGEQLKTPIENGKNWQVLRTYSPFTVLDDNVIEWAESSGLKNSLVDYNDFILNTGAEAVEDDFYSAKIYNPGYTEADFQIALRFVEINTGNKTDINIQIGDDIFRFTPNVYAGETIVLNTKNHTLTVYHGNNLKSLRYDFIKSTHWLKIPKGESNFIVTTGGGVYKIDIAIKYNYKYY